MVEKIPINQFLHENVIVLNYTLIARMNETLFIEYNEYNKYI